MALPLIRQSLLALPLLTIVFAGCDAQPRTDDLGEIVYRIPALPEASTPYLFPELSELPPDAAESSSERAQTADTPGS